MISNSVQGAHVLGLLTMGLRNMYSKKEIHSVADVKGEKVRVQATMTEDTHFPAYGAQTVHMPFGEVYTSLQTGVVQIAENGVNVYMANKHYEVAPDPFDDRARGEQQLHLGQRQDLEQPHAPSSSNGCRRPPTRSPRRSPRWPSSSRADFAEKLERWASRLSRTSTSRAS